jgi:hypothetical protein
MSSMRFSARLDASHHGQPHQFKYAAVVADSLTGIRSAMVKCLFVVNSSCIHKGFYGSPQVKIQRIHIWRACRPYSGSSSTYPSVMILRTSRTARAGAPSCMYSILSIVTQIKCFRIHFDMDICSCFGMWNWCPKFVRTFQLHSV